MVSQLNQVYVDVGSQQMQARQRGEEPAIANMGQKLFPMLSSLHAYMASFFSCSNAFPGMCRWDSQTSEEKLQ